MPEVSSAASAAVTGARPLAKNGYRVDLVKGLVVDALIQLHAP